MKHLDDRAHEPQQPRPDEGHADTQHQSADPAPLDVVTYKNLSALEHDDRQANMALAERLEPFDPDLATALRLCASGCLNCNRRVCPRCSRARSVRMTSRYDMRLAKMVEPFHLTATEYPIEDLTRPVLDQTRGRFRLLRRRIKNEKKLSVLGGVANVEIALTEDEDRWLVHLHAVIDAPLAPTENWLRETWQALGGGQQVRITPIVRGTQKMVFAYGTKRPVIPTTSAMLQQFVTATKGFRAMAPFGNLHHAFGKAPPRRAPAATGSPAKPPKPVFFKDILKRDPVLRAEVRRLVKGGSRVQGREARS